MKTKIEIKDYSETRIIGRDETIKVIMTTDKNGSRFLNIEHSSKIIVRKDLRDESILKDSWKKYFYSY